MGEAAAWAISLPVLASHAFRLSRSWEHGCAVVVLVGGLKVEVAVGAVLRVMLAVDFGSGVL